MTEKRQQFNPLNVFVLVALLLAGAQALPAFADSIPCAEWSSGFGLSGPNNYVFALKAFDDGSGPAMFAAGAFVSIGGQALNYIAKFDGSKWSSLGSGMNYSVFALESV